MPRPTTSSGSSTTAGSTVGARPSDAWRGRWEQLRLIHLPVHASWLNQIEIYFSILQRKAWTPDDCASFEAAQARLLGFQAHYQTHARPFAWTFTRDDLAKLLARLEAADTTNPLPVAA